MDRTVDQPGARGMAVGHGEQGGRTVDPRRLVTCSRQGMEPDAAAAAKVQDMAALADARLLQHGEQSGCCTARKIAKAGVMNVGKIGLVKGCHGSLWIVRGSSA
jgi:hypothetical protein